MTSAEWALLVGQVVLGLVNGSFYALLSLGLAVIFGMLQVINFAHGALYMAGAFVAWMAGQYLGIGFWPALLVAPILVGLGAALFERTLIAPLYKAPPVYGLLVTFGVALILQGGLREIYGVGGLPYSPPEIMRGGFGSGIIFIPYFRAFVVVVSLAICFGVWFLIERTRYGIYIRATAENPQLLRAFGVRVNRILTLTFACGAALAALAGVLAAPVYMVSSVMGADLIVLVFAIVVIGGMGSIKGPVIAAYAVGVFEGLAKAYVPSIADMVVFILMAAILLLRPAGLFGKAS